MILGREQLEQRRSLRAVAEAAADSHLTLVGANQPRADLHQGALAGAVLTGQGDDLAGAHLQLDVLEDGRRAEALDDVASYELVHLGPCSSVGATEGTPLRGARSGRR